MNLSILVSKFIQNNTKKFNKDVESLIFKFFYIKHKIIFNYAGKKIAYYTFKSNSLILDKYHHFTVKLLSNDLYSFGIGSENFAGYWVDIENEKNKIISLKLDLINGIYTIKNTNKILLHTNDFFWSDMITFQIYFDNPLKDINNKIQIISYEFKQINKF